MLEGYSNVVKMLYHGVIHSNKGIPVTVTRIVDAASCKQEGLIGLSSSGSANGVTALFADR